jgi:hypothetical protein
VDRIDGLPEQTIYHDDGCGHGCVRSLECPFAACRYDEPGIWRKKGRRERAERVLELRRTTGLTVDQVAEAVGVSRRTVHRILAGERDSCGGAPASGCEDDD